MSGLYPRTVEIHRPKTVAAASGAADTIGLTGYSGMTVDTSSSDPQGETVLFTGVPASIQAAATGRKRDSALPQDAVSNPTWNVFIPAMAVPNGSIRDRDIIIDDEQYRYEVGQAYWNMLGYKCMCIRLEA
ncbi:hypothetical protein [Bradyrhizobium sp. Tv2a-2]|uniref:hypothetical protein n=1 Tax=Bradyrhizobium sp. Tv2a-2 TaxID=113395 RepID=UPI0003FD54D2|nr:hypothetical protein [Bradyrhizobium sp. Tv2a-2]